MPTASIRALLVVLLVGGAAAGWLLLGDRGSEPSELPTEPVPPAAQPVRPDPGGEEPIVLPPGDAEVVVEPPAVEPPAVEAPTPPPEAAPAAFLYPEQLKLETAAWENVPARDVLTEIGRQARIEMRIPANVAKILEGKRVTMDLGSTTGAIVIARVLQPHGLNYTVRGGVVHIFVDDD